MENKSIKAHNNFFLYIILLSIITVSIFSFYRFFIAHDYFVSYSVECDPSIDSCFIKQEEGSSDVESNYYYIVKKYAPDLYNKCGDDVTNCEYASKCFLGDRNCSITYCDTTTDSCAATFTQNDIDVINI